MADLGARRRAVARLSRAKPAPLPTFGNRQSAIGNSVTACPICRKPFEDDAEVGPVPTCECGDRGKVDLEECPFPTDNFRMMNAKWSGPDHG